MVLVKIEMLINSGVCRKTYFIYSTFTYEQFQITKYKALVTVVLREGRAPARMLFHQEGTRHGLLLHGPGFLPHVGMMESFSSLMYCAAGEGVGGPATRFSTVWQSWCCRSQSRLQRAAIRFQISSSSGRSM